MDGFHGNYLHMDLTRGTARRVALAPDSLRETLGGVGLGVSLLLRHTHGAYEPLSPEAPLVFAFGPLVGTALNTSAKAAVLSKSPLTHRLNDAMISSGFALAGKGTGHDALVITGTCAAWSTLFVEGDRAEIRPTPQLVGLSAAASESNIRRDWGQDWNVAAIGAAGENQVPYALLSHDGRHAGRGGTGAVLGAKRLKAIAVRGALPTPVADPPALGRWRELLQQRSLGHATEKYRTTGTLGNLGVFNRLGILPTRNFSATSHGQAEALSAERLFAQGGVTRATCADCMIGCEKRVVTASGHTVRLEFENVFSLGPLLDIWDADTVLEASGLCDEVGLDTITTGGTLAFAMECVEKGLLAAPELRFADGALLLSTIPLIARREGIGAMLALGSRALARTIGRGSEAFAPHVKGLELPGYHPAGLQSLGLGLAVAARGADHNKSGAYDLDLSGSVDRFALDPGRISAMVELEDRAVVMDSLILCKFVRGALEDFHGEVAAILTALTGAAYAPEHLKAAAGRIHDMRKLFNQQQGWDISEDTLPPRFFQPAGQNGGAVPGIDPEAFREARRHYYATREWDEAGKLPAHHHLLAP